MDKCTDILHNPVKHFYISMHDTSVSGGALVTNFPCCIENWRDDASMQHRLWTLLSQNVVVNLIIVSERRKRGLSIRRLLTKCQVHDRTS